MTNLFKKKFIRVPHLSAGSALKEIGRNAFVDWILILIVTTVTAAALIGGGVYLYWQISSGNFKVAENTQLVEKIFDKDELDSLITRFETRNEASAQIRKGYKGPTDPSL
ncbi:MAG: hypothetical protein QG640_647 [Patescibacteria group bacterium]|nr:hypothetical protein [Patescibacteria group bacterium]